MTQTTPDFSHAANLRRVMGVIADAILDFCRAHVGATFHADELRRHVAAVAQVAPGSADRVLRALRQAGQLDYVVESRRASLYRITRVEPAAQRRI